MPKSKQDNLTPVDNSQCRRREKTLSKAKRKAIGNKTRFEVFKRDSFTCQYCGASAPQVILNCDHIKPVVSGGTNRITNLVTSCFGCNSGKGGRELSDDAVVNKQKAQLDELQERRQQLEMMMEWHAGITEIKKDESVLAVEYFNSQMREHGSRNILNEAGGRAIRNAVKKYPFNDVLKAIDIGFTQYIDRAGSESENVSECLGKLAGICKYMHVDDYDKRMFYLRRVIDKRHREMHHSTVSWFFEECRAAKAAGVPLDTLESLVKNGSGIQSTIEGIARLAHEWLSQEGV